MLCLVCVYYFLLCFKSANCNSIDDDIKKLPNIFEKDDYESCDGTTDKKFCDITMELHPINGNTSLHFWKLIEFTKASHAHFDHGILYYRKCANNSDDLFEKYHNKQYENIGLYSTVKKIHCQVPNTFSLGLYEIVVLSLISVYVVFVVYITLRLYFEEERFKDNKAMAAFSIIKNFEKVTDINKNKSKIKSVDGIRIIAMFLAMSYHLSLRYYGTHWQNVQSAENALSTLHSFLPFEIYNYHSNHLMQTFLILSSFILSSRVHKIYEADGEFSLKNIWLMMLHRLLRFLPVLIFTVTIFSLVFTGDNLDDYFFDERINTCRIGWFSTLTFLQNTKLGLPCHGGAWFLATETQLYLITLLTFYFLKKYKLKYKVIGIMIIITLIWHGFIIYLNNLDIVFRPKLGMERLKTLFTFETMIVYKSITANLPTYLIGFYFGHFYFYNKDKGLFRKTFRTSKWWTLGIFLLILPDIVAINRYSQIISAIIGPLLKPICGFGSAILILGMLYNDAPALKNICENKYLLVISNLNYSIYHVHFLLFLLKDITFQPSWFLFVNSIMKVTCWTFILAFLVHLFVELPMSNLQKIYIPNVTYAKFEKQE